MELNSERQEKKPCGLILISITEKIKSGVVETITKTKKIGEEDPRRIVHSMKVGLALTLVSFFYYLRPLYDEFGQAGMWAILTVVVVFEYTVGGTLSKSINRGCATLLAGALGVGAEYLASMCGEKGEPIILALLVFFLAMASTFARFFPNVKRKYDYGVLIFILTFSLVAVSGIQVTQILQLAHQRLSTIVIGGATCIMISIFVCPVWAGQDLHNLVAGNIGKIADYLEGLGDEILPFSSDEDSKNDEKAFLTSYKSLLNSRATEESLANFAWWEPGHGCFKFQHPWKEYLKVGALIRECACHIEALNGHINLKSHETVKSDFQMKIRQACIDTSKESSKALKELATAIKKMTSPSPPPSPSLSVGTHTQSSKSAAHELQTILENSSLPPKVDLQEIMPLLVVASALIDITNCVNEISSSLQQVLHRRIVKPVNDVTAGGGGDHVVVEVV